MNYLMDKNFLKKLDAYPLREIYARIISLTLEEYPIDEIQGRVTAGSINLDGDSAVRRTCSLTLITDDLELRDYYWGLKTKFKLEIGMRNFVDSKYPSIVWFPEGTFLITQFNTSQNGTGYSVSISGKDKMSLLNGEITGKIHANSTRFDVLDEYDKDGNRHEIKVPIREIIQEVVHEYGNEPLHNIIINDVDDYGVELLEYRGKDPMYLVRNAVTDEPQQIILNDEQYVWIENTGGSLKNFLSKITFDPLVSNGLMNYKAPTYMKMSNGAQYDSNAALCKMAKIEMGQTAGYRLTELTYPGELIVASGETVTGVLDKIKSMLGDFEYFYDLNGRFVFQRKPVYINKSWNTLKRDGTQDNYGRYNTYSESMMDVSPVSYQFQDNKLLLSIANTPNYSNLKNDFSIWGKRTTISGAELPIHLRYAIQHRPKIYRKISDNAGADPDKVLKGDIFISSFTTMEERKDFLKDFNQTKIMPASGGLPAQVLVEGYKIWIVDWRELIYQMALDYRRLNHDNDYEFQLHYWNPWLLTQKTGFEQYYVDMEGFWRQIYSLKLTNTMHPYWSIQDLLASANISAEAGEWAEEVETNPEMLNFWIDFLDTEGDMGKYGVDVIGDRAQIVNDDSIKAVWFKDTPLVIYYDASEEKTINRSKEGAYKYLSMAGINDLFSISSQGRSTKDELDTQLQNYSLCTESVTITALPIYYLQPNTRISVKNNEDINVNGEYVVSKITLPLTHNGTMSITAVKDSPTLL